jgi:hypothetical protein
MGEASWAYGHGSVSDLLEDPRLAIVVVGTVERKIGETAEQAGSLVFTDFAVAVEQTYLGAASEGVVVHQTGGATDDITFELTDDPLFAPGERYILFLAYDERSSLYFTLSPAARLLIRDGLAYSLTAIYPDRGISDLGLDGVPVHEILDAVD